MGTKIPPVINQRETGLALFTKRSAILLYMMDPCCFRLCKAHFIGRVAAVLFGFCFVSGGCHWAHWAGWEGRFPSDVLFKGVTCVDQSNGSECFTTSVYGVLSIFCDS